MNRQSMHLLWPVPAWNLNRDCQRTFGKAAEDWPHSMTLARGSKVPRAPARLWSAASPLPLSTVHDGFSLRCLLQ